MRSRRFDSQIHMEKTKHNERLNIFAGDHKKSQSTGYLENITEFDYNYLASITENFTGADIKKVFQIAINNYILGKLNNSVQNINLDQMIKIIHTFKL